MLALCPGPDVDDSEELIPRRARRWTEMVVVVVAILIVGTTLTLSVVFLGSPLPPPFDFSLSISPSSSSVAAGGSVSATVTATLLSGSTRDVSYSCTDLQFGDCSFTLSSCSPTCSAGFVIDTSPTTPLGTHTVTLQASNGTLSRSVAFTVTVTIGPPPPAFDFSLSVNPTSGSVAAGDSVSATITATL